MNNKSSGTSFLVAVLLTTLSLTISSCSPTASSGAPAADTPAKKYVFGTSLGRTGNLGGLAGADTICATHASAAGLPGTWKAWLSDETTNAIDRIAEVGPWYLIGTTIVAATTKASFALSPSAAININENGLNMGSVDYWTGTASGGAKIAGSTCTSWTTTAGNGATHGQFNTGAWTAGGNVSCAFANTLKLACIQQ